MDIELKERLVQLYKQYQEIGIAEQIDYNKFYLYSLISHSTAIEGSTLTELETQLLFDDGIFPKSRTMMEQWMNIDLKNAYDFAINHLTPMMPITPTLLCSLAARVMQHTGGEYNTFAGNFSAAKGELRKLNVTAGIGGASYMSYLKVPERLKAFCYELNQRRKELNTNNIGDIYELSYWAHYELVTIHPWTDGNGRMARLLMNIIQIQANALPSNVLKEEKQEYIQALINAQRSEDSSIFIDEMTKLHCKHLLNDMQRFIACTSDKCYSTSDKTELIYDFIVRNPESNTQTIAKYIGLSPARTRFYLAQLVKDGKLIAYGANKNRTYSVKGTKY